MREKINFLKKSSFIRFCLVGVINTLVGASIMFGLYNLAHCSYWLSTAANYAVGGVVSFVLNKHFTFKAKGDTKNQAIRFFINVLVCYVLAYSIAKPLVYSLLENSSVLIRDNLSMLVGMVMYTLLNYLGQKFFAFRAKKTD